MLALSPVISTKEVEELVKVSVLVVLTTCNTLPKLAVPLLVIVAPEGITMLVPEAPRLTVPPFTLVVLVVLPTLTVFELVPPKVSTDSPEGLSMSFTSILLMFAP